MVTSGWYPWLGAARQRSKADLRVASAPVLPPRPRCRVSCALHLAAPLTQADPSDREGHELVAEVCEALVERERSFIARGFYQVAAVRARAAAGEA